jgi:hypothetical protein
LELVEESPNGEEHGEIVAFVLSVLVHDWVISDLQHDSPIWLWYFNVA